MRIPPRSAVAISLIVIGSAFLIWGAEGLWGVPGAYFVSGIVAVTVGVLLGVSE